MKKIILPILILLFTSIASATTYECDTAGEITTALAVADDDDIIDIRAGTYAVELHPTNSGSAGHYITIQAHTGETVTIGGSITYGALLSDRSYIKIDGINFGTTNSYWIYSSGGSNNYIVNCDFSAEGNGMAWEGCYMLNTSYNVFEDCTLSTPCTPADLLQFRGNSDYNIVTGCHFGTANHSALRLFGTYQGSPEYNVVKGNTFQNTFHHNVEFFDGVGRNLLENNLIYDAGGSCDAVGCPSNTCGIGTEGDLRFTHNGFKISAEYCIIRRNFFSGNGDISVAAWKDKDKYCRYNRIYNNTSYEDYRSIIFGADDGTINLNEYNKVVNNIFSSGLEYGLQGSTNVETTNDVFYNNFYDGTAYNWKTKNGSISSIETAWPGEVFDNISVDPGFTDAANRDFSIGSGSAMVNAGSWLTTITSATGNGTSFVVADSYFFMDGWGIVTGDEIQLEGDATSVTVTDVNYATHTITVDTSVSWTQGDGVALAYSGSGPDIGAYEYGSSAPPPPPDPDPPLNNCTSTEVKVSQTVDAGSNGLSSDARGQTITLPAGFYSGVVCGFTCSNAGNATLRIGPAGASDATDLTTAYTEEVVVAVSPEATTAEYTFTFTEPLYLSGKYAIGLTGTGSINWRKAGTDAYAFGKPLGSTTSNGWNMDIVANDDKYFKMIGCSGTFAVNTGAAGKAAILFGP